jgi:hypothetical protein
MGPPPPQIRASIAIAAIVWNPTVTAHTTVAHNLSSPNVVWQRSAHIEIDRLSLSNRDASEVTYADRSVQAY